MANKQTGRKPKPVTIELTSRAVKLALGDLLSRAGFGNERIAITRHGKRIAGLVSADDLARLDAA